MDTEAPLGGQAPWRELQADTKDLGTQMTSFFACQPEQEAYERRFLDQQRPRHAGQFSHFLLESLQDARADLNHDGTVSNRELLQYISRRLDESFNRTRPDPGGYQNPAMETNFPDAAVLMRSPSKDEMTNKSE